MQYTDRAFGEGQDASLDDICEIFSSTGRTAYNMLRVGMDAGVINAILREISTVKYARQIQ
jgi:hypothetical protein